MTTLFISYRRSDSEEVTGRIHDRLVDEFGPKRVCKDVDTLVLGRDYRKEIETWLDRSNVILVIIGRNWLNAVDERKQLRLSNSNDPVRVELRHALRDDRRLVVPILLGSTVMPAEESLPEDIRALVYRNAINVRPDPDFHHDMGRLIAAVREHGSLSEGPVNISNPIGPSVTAGVGRAWRWLRQSPAWAISIAIFVSGSVVAIAMSTNDGKKTDSSADPSTSASSTVQVLAAGGSTASPSGIGGSSEATPLVTSVPVNPSDPSPAPTVPAKALSTAACQHERISATGYVQSRLGGGSIATCSTNFETSLVPTSKTSSANLCECCQTGRDCGSNCLGSIKSSESFTAILMDLRLPNDAAPGDDIVCFRRSGDSNPWSCGCASEAKKGYRDGSSLTIAGKDLTDTGIDVAVFNRIADKKPRTWRYGLRHKSGIYRVALCEGLDFRLEDGTAVTFALYDAQHPKCQCARGASTTSTTATYSKLKPLGTARPVGTLASP